MAASVAVVIVNWNSGELLDRSLAALKEQTTAPARVIVVDNASADGSADRAAASEGVDLIRLPENLGFAAANNRGVSHATDVEWIALLNPDAFPEPRWLETLLATAQQHPEASFFASRLVSANSPELLDGTGDVYCVNGLSWRRDHGRPVSKGVLELGEVFSACAAAALYRRDRFLEVGGFDESFFCYFEDVDLAFRLRLIGERCLYVPGAVVHHVGSAVTGRRSEFTVYHGHRNLVWTFFKNMPAPLLWLYLPQHILLNLVSVLAFALRGEGRAMSRAKWHALRGLPEVLQRRRSVQARRRIGWRELRRTMARGLWSPYVRGAR